MNKRAKHMVDRFAQKLATFPPDLKAQTLTYLTEVLVSLPPPLSPELEEIAEEAKAEETKETEL